MAVIAERFPGSPVTKIHPALFPGWYEIITSSELVYTDASADHLFVGKVIDTRTKVDLTSKRLGELLAIDFKSLPLDLAVKTVKGNGQRTVAIFEDPNCPFCRQLEQNVKDVTDVTIYRFLYPLEKLHPGATVRARAIWCAPDRSVAWNQWMQDHVEPPQASCPSDPLAQIQILGDKLDVAGTPMTFFSDGHRVEGVIDQVAMERQLTDSTGPAKP